MLHSELYSADPKDMLSAESLAANNKLIEAGVPEPIAFICAWLAGPMFSREYQNLDCRDMIVTPRSAYDLSSQRRYSSDYDVWIGVGYESAHSDAACKLHFEFSDSGELLWCNVSEWAVDDDRWRGVRVFYDPRNGPMNMKQLYNNIDAFFLD